MRRAGNSKRELTSARARARGSPSPPCREADDGERGQAVGEVYLDGDLGRIESREGTAVKHRERHGAPTSA